MLVQRKSPIDGKLNSREINITPVQMMRWQNGEMIQRVVPHLSPDDREFIVSGTTPEEWDELQATLKPKK